MPKERVYKAVMLPEDLHQEIKVKATAEMMTIIEFISNLVEKYETNNKRDRRSV